MNIVHSNIRLASQLIKFDAKITFAGNIYFTPTSDSTGAEIITKVISALVGVKPVDKPHASGKLYWHIEEVSKAQEVMRSLKHIEWMVRTAGTSIKRKRIYK